MIARADLHSIIVTSAVAGLPADIDYETELVIDSVTLVRMRHVLEEQYGMVIDPQVEDMSSFTSINEIYAYLACCFPDRIASVEENTP